MTAHIEIAGPVERLLTTAEAAEVLRLSPRSMEDFRWRGGGPRYLKLGRNCCRYRHSDLLDWAESKARHNTSHAPNDAFSTYSQPGNPADGNR